MVGMVWYGFDGIVWYGVGGGGQMTSEFIHEQISKLLHVMMWIARHGL